MNNLFFRNFIDTYIRVYQTKALHGKKIHRFPLQCSRCLNQVKVLIEIYHSGLFFNKLGTVPILKQGYLKKK
jgi:hypothetical protein